MASRSAINFVPLFTICYLAYTALFSFVPGINRSLKRHFQVSDCVIGWLCAAAGLGYALTVLVTAYFGGRGNRRTRWIGGGFLLVILGCLLVVAGAFVAPLPTVQDPKDETHLWHEAFIPLTREDITTSKSISKTMVARRFPEDVRKYLADGDFKLSENRSRRSAKWPLDKALMIGLAVDRVRRDLYSENVDTYERPKSHHLVKRELPDWEFPDDLKERLTNGFTEAVMGFYTVGWDSYDKFAERLYNLSNDPELYQRIMRASRLPFGYCRNASSIVRGMIKEETCEQRQQSTALAGLILALIGFALIGIGSTPIWTITISVLDDEFHKYSLPCLLSAIFMVQWLSFPLGAVTGLLLEFKLYAGLRPSKWLTAIDPRWVGAWWLGFVAVAAVLLIPALIIAFLSRAGSPNANRTDYIRAPAQENSQCIVRAHVDCGEVGKWNGFVGAIFEVCRPPIFVALLLALTFDALALKGYFDFLPKFFENNYSPSIWKGTLPFWMYLIGISIGGFLFRLNRMDGRKAALYIVGCTLIAAILSLAQSHHFFSCDNVVRRIQQAGIVNTTNGRPNWPSCRGCICDVAEFYPVCANDSESTPYYSPCHAGCTNFTYEIVGTNVEFQFDYCFCSPAKRMNVSRGICKDDCSRSTGVYVALSSIAGLLSGCVVVPVILFLLRSAIHEFRSLALGIVGLSICLFGFLPSALIYRFIADSTCFVWRASCPRMANQVPTCEIFDGPLLRERLHLFLGVLRLISVLFYGLVSYHAKDVKLYVKGNRPTVFEAEMRQSPQKDEGLQKHVHIDTMTANNSVGIGNL